MKKVLFLMLFLIVLGAASVKAQVRIGGNTAPNAAAVLDLNATDATNNGTKGLALPRVNLTSNTMQLTSGVVNLTGMLVYNTTATLGVGIYSWTGSIWEKVDAVPTTVPTDSGLFLMSTGSGVVWNYRYHGDHFTDTVHYPNRNIVVTWTLIFDSMFTFDIPQNGIQRIPVPGMVEYDFCSTGPYNMTQVAAINGELRAWTLSGLAAHQNARLRCFHPSN